MHIPNGFVNAPVAISTALLSVAGIGFSFWQTRRTLPAHRVPLMGLSAAFVFAAQMINFPVLGGTSGHLVGGVLVGALLGPSAAAIVLGCVLILQCLLFADGGITALGANVFNMAILGGVAGTAIYGAIRRVIPGAHGRFTGALFAGWFSTVLASAACAGEVCLSGHAHATVKFPAMLGVHMLIGIGEGLITALVLESLARTNPELLADQLDPQGRMPAILVWGFLIALGIAAFISPFACPWPDGLEAVAGKLGIQESAIAPVLPALIPDYRMPRVGSPGLAVAAGGVVGTGIMFLSAWGVAKLLVRRVPAKSPAA
jgi:cobalt/nickel transport system permease protein